MKKIILDTDIGADCDDAVAIGLLMELEAQGVCCVEGITTSTTREGATEAIEAILSYYGRKKKLGRMHTPMLACDSIDNYAAAMKAQYGGTEIKTDSVELMRHILTDTEDRITLIVIGPLSNIANLLKSQGDDISPLSGMTLVAERVECIYIMGGSFTQYDASGMPVEEAVIQEWNIVQDIASATYVMEYCPCEMVLCPFEAGNRVFTNMRNGYNPIWYAMKCFAGNRITADNPHFRRESWDPVTCLAATQDCSAYFSLSDRGSVTVEQDGTTLFRKDSTGKTRFLKDKGHYEELGAWIDSLIRD